MKRIPTLFLVLGALLLIGVMPARGQDAHPVEADASHPAGDHDHPAIDNRLVPIPPSKDTIVSAIWVIVIFAIMVVILYKFAWQNVLVGLKKREEGIRNNIADAEAARAKAEATLKEYNVRLATAENQVRDMLSKAASEAERIAANLKANAQQDAEEIKERATRDIETARTQALADVKTHIVDLATAAAAQILRKNLNADDQRELVNRSLDQMQTMKN